MTTKRDPRKPRSNQCPIGSFGAHTWNFERTECIWCGPNSLAWNKTGHWESLEGDFRAWSVPEIEAANTPELALTTSGSGPVEP